MRAASTVHRRATLDPDAVIVLHMMVTMMSMLVMVKVMAVMRRGMLVLILTFQVALVWRVGDDEEGWLTYHQLSGMMMLLMMVMMIISMMMMMMMIIMTMLRAS